MMQLVTCTEEMVATRDGTEILMIVCRPKTLESQNAAAYFYAHGGGAYAMTAKHTEAAMARVAVNLNCVTFNIDYRLGPEVKAPVGQQDFVDVVNYVLANPAKYGIDPAKCCLSGCSGGGWIAVGAANLLAKAGDLAKIKAIFVQTAMLSNSCQNIPQDQWEFYE